MVLSKRAMRIATPLVLGLAVLITAYLAILLTRETNRIAAIWPANALILAVLIATPRREWRWSLISAWTGNLLANVASGDQILNGALLAAANSLEVLVAVTILGRVSPMRLMRRSGLVRFAIATLVGCCASTAAVALIFAVSATALTFQTAGLWFAADLLGLVVFTPILSALSSKRVTAILRQDGRRTLVLLVGLAATSAAVFYQTRFPLLFIPGAVLVLVAVSSGYAGAAIGVLIVSVIAVWGTVQGRGPIVLVDGPLPVQILIMQVFLLTLTLISLIAGSTLAERQSLVARLTNARAGQQRRAARERMLVDQAHLAEKMSKVGYWSWNTDTGEFYRSPEIIRINGNANRSYSQGEQPESILERAAGNYCDEDRERVLAIMQEGARTGEGWEFDATLVRGGDGARRFVTAMAAAQKDEAGRVIGYFGVLKDLTEEREIINALAERERQYRLLADNSGDVIATYDAAGVFTYLSPSIREMLGYAPDDLLGKTAYEIILPEDAKATARAFAAAAADGEIRSIEYRALHRTGEIRWLEARPSFRRDETGAILEVTDTVRDVTERREREAALAEARQTAEAAAAAKSEFLANMSHEIRTPLNGIIGFSEVLSRTALSSEQSGFVQKIRKAGAGLITLVNDILDSAKVEAGRMTLDERPYDLVTLIAEVTELTQAAAASRLVVETRSTDTEPALQEGPWVLGDEHRVRQILLNLLGNAVKFTQAGSVRVLAALEDQDVVIRVVDTGMGISAENLGKLFKEFSQAESGTSRQFGGTGLGLSISRSLARLMGGDVRIESTEGVGTTAIFTLPYRPTAPATLAAHERVQAGIAGSTPVSLKVLVVDDVEDNLELVDIMLRQWGHRPVLASSAAEGIEILEAAGPFDMVLMDVQMPLMDGLAATRAIRAMGGALGEVPIVALTANVMAGQVAECRAAGMDDHIAKPIRMEDLLSVLGRVADLVGSPSPTPAVANPAIQAISDRYREHMASFADELSRSDDLPLAARAKAVAAFAHAVGGTAGSLGFEEVSKAAFQLERIAKDPAVSTASLNSGISALLNTVPPTAELA